MNANIQIISWAALVAFGAALPSVVCGQIVLNVPPDPAPPLLTNAETLNLLPGGRLGNDFLVGEDAVLNVEGGIVGNDLRAFPTSAIHLSSGSIGTGLHAEGGSTVRVSGGRIGDDAVIQGDFTLTGGTIERFLRIGGGTTTISGGEIGRYFGANQDAVVRMTGGLIDDLGTYTVHNFEMRGGSVGEFSSNNATFYGSDFRLDGRPIAGLDHPGDEVQFTMPAQTLFTGVLADGTPFAFDVIHHEDDIRGPVRLIREDPPPGPEVINVPGDPVPNGIRAGQTLNLHRGGTLPNHFTAATGSTLNLLGGRIGRNFEAFGATLNIFDGYIGASLDSGDAFDGTVINMMGGTIDRSFSAWSGATINFSDGRIGDNFDLRAGATLNMTGGSLDHSFSAWGGSTWNLSGGRLGGTLSASGGEEPTLTIHGFDFQLDREPVEGLAEPGDEVIIPALRDTGTLFTGRLADGTPFAIRDDAGQQLYNPVRLVLTEPPAGPTVINVPADAAPPGVGRGQTLNLRAGGDLGKSFIAGVGSVVNIEGGRVGDFFQAVDAEVNVHGGRIGAAFDAFDGAVVTISGGTFGRAFDAYPGSTIIIEGTHFTLDGVVFSDLDEPGDSVVLTTRGRRELRATLADGSLFDVRLEPRPDVLAFGHDYIDPAATLRLVVVGPVIPEPGTLLLLATCATCGWICVGPHLPRSVKELGARGLTNADRYSIHTNTIRDSEPAATECRRRKVSRQDGPHGQMSGSQASERPSNHMQRSATFENELAS